MENSVRYSFNPWESRLILVDPQLAFGQVIKVPDVKQALDKMRQLAWWWREKGGRVVATSHSYSDRSKVGRAFDFFGAGIYDLLQNESKMAEFWPGIEDVRDYGLTKTRYGVMSDPDSAKQIKNFVPENSVCVVAGLTTPICVLQSVAGLMAAGYRVVVAGDACASQAIPPHQNHKKAHQNALDIMAYCCAEVLTTDQVIRRAGG